MNVSRIDIGTFAIDPEPTNFSSIAESVIKELTPKITEKSISFIKNFDKNIPDVVADPKLIRIIFQNLISNSVKYTPPSGKVEVQIILDNEFIQIIVKDNGYGIPQNQQDKIFTKLFRADNILTKETDGTGLGLYIVKSIVDVAGGSINFCSEENKGTEFRVRLPLKGMEKKWYKRFNINLY